MITNPKNGWCSFQLGTFEGRISCLTDAPVELLDAFIDYHEKGAGVAVLDEEGSYFTLLLTRYNMGIYIIEERDRVVLHDFSDMDIEGLEKELIADIKRDFSAWVSEFVVSEDDIIRHQKEISERLKKIGMTNECKNLEKAMTRLQRFVDKREKTIPDDPCKFFVNDEIARDFRVAIGAMKELKMYKDSKLCLVPENIFTKQCEELDAYKEIGTIEEVRDAVERQKPKKVMIESWCPARCPRCGKALSEHLGDGIYHHPSFLERCPECAQKLDWEGV